jgi:hypothetical protein
MKSNIEKVIFSCMIIAGLIWMILGALLIQNTIHVFKDYARVELSQRHYYDSSEAAKTLQTGSNMLTEQARLYAITNDLRHLLAYFREKNTYRRRERAIEILSRRGFNEDILEDEIQASKQDYGEEFFWTVLHHPEMVDEWADKHGLSDKTSARNFVLLCFDFG